MNLGLLLNNNYNMVGKMRALNNNISKSINRLSTGKSINSAADSPSDMIRISRLESKIRGSQVAQRNIQDGMSLLQTTEDSVNGLSNLGQKLRELASKYNNGTLSADDKKSIEDEGKGLLNEMGNIIKNTSFNNINVFDNPNYVIQTGSNAGDTYNIQLDGFTKLKSIISPGTTSSTTTTSGTSSSSSGTINNNYQTGVSFTHSQANYTGWDKLYDNNMNLMYEGNFTNGTPDGYGKVYNSNGAMTYCGELKQGKFDGYGTLNDDTGKTIYSGNFTNGVFNGYGNLYNNGALVYSGNFSNGQYSTTSQSNPTNSFSGTAENTNSTSTTGNTNSLNIKDILNTDFIDKNILDPIAACKTSLGISENSLECRYDIQQNIEDRSNDYFSKLTDVDVAKEMLNKTKNELLLNTNISLFSDNLENEKGYILQLLK